MPHINDAPNVEVNVRIDKFRYTKAVEKVPAQINCSLCACAGVITHATGNVVTSGEVAGMVPLQVALHNELLVGGADNYLQHSETFSGLGWTGKQPNSYLTTGGMNSTSSINTTNSGQIKGIIRTAKQALGLVDVLKIGDTAAGDQARCLRECIAYMNEMANHGFIFAVLSPAEGHWNFAHKVGASIQFVDYQTDHANLRGAPTIGAQFQKGLGGGDADGGASGVVLAFQKADLFPNGPAT